MKRLALIIAISLVMVSVASAQTKSADATVFGLHLGAKFSLPECARSTTGDAGVLNYDYRSEPSLSVFPVDQHPDVCSTEHPALERPECKNPLSHEHARNDVARPSRRDRRWEPRRRSDTHARSRISGRSPGVAEGEVWGAFGVSGKAGTKRDGCCVQLSRSGLEF
jgi:hypothetical protein